MSTATSDTLESQALVGVQRAYTLLEMLIVVALLTVAVAAVALNLDGFTTQGRLRAAAGQVAAAHRLARAEAVSSGQPRRLLFAGDQAEILLQQPHYQGGRWAWSPGRAIRIAGEVQVTCTAANQEKGAGGFPVDIRGDGRSPDYTCLLSVATASRAVHVEGATGIASVVEHHQGEVNSEYSP